MKNYVCCGMTAMSIEDEQPRLSVRFVSSVGFKVFSKPLSTMCVTRPPLRITGKYPVVWCICCKPASGKSFTFEDDHRWKRSAVHRNTLQNRDPFLSSRLHGISRALSLVNHNSRRFDCSKRKSCFIHIVDVFSSNVVGL